MNTADHAIDLTFAAGDASFDVRVRVDGERCIVGVGDRAIVATVAAHDGDLAITLDGERLTASVVALADERYVFSDESMQRLRCVDPLAHAGEDADAGDGHLRHLRAPMSGTVISVLVKTGDAVARGAPLLILRGVRSRRSPSVRATR
jgi:biotin carboxyl carrier protein